jgi:tetratricopeptide (TPR) repeat protein
MFWIIASAVVAILVFLFLNTKVHKSLALSRAAMMARKQKDWPMAAKFYRESHDLAGKLHEPLKSRIQAQVEIDWASLLHRQGKMREAADLFQQGFSKASVTSRRVHILVHQGYLCWGDLCADEGRHHDAELQYRKALEGDEKSGNLGGTIFDMQRLADSLIRQERREEAEEVIQRAIALETRVVHEQLVRQGKNPAEHPVISMSLPDLHFCREQYEDARRLYQEKVAFWEKQVTRPDNVDVGHLQMRLALAEARTGHRAAAIEMYTRAESTFRREWCEGHPKAVAAHEAKAALVEEAVQVEA